MATERTAVACSHCGHELRDATPQERACVAEGGWCQGCRAFRVLLRRPWLLAQLAGAWDGAGYPESPSWLAGLPAERV
jgi:hypothetical protein